MWECFREIMTVSKEWLEEVMAKATPDGKVALRLVYDKHVQRAKGQSGISKAWLSDLIRGETIPERRVVFQMVFDKLTELIPKSDDKSPDEPKPINHNAVYENIFLYYVNHGKTPEEAHIIARDVIEAQQQKQKTLEGF